MEYRCNGLYNFYEKVGNPVFYPLRVVADKNTRLSIKTRNPIQRPFAKVLKGKNFDIQVEEVRIDDDANVFIAFEYDAAGGKKEDILERKMVLLLGKDTILPFSVFKLRNGKKAEKIVVGKYRDGVFIERYYKKGVKWDQVDVIMVRPDHATNYC